MKHDDRVPSGAFWPSPLQELLLTGALAGPQEAVGAWREAAQRFNLDELEPGSFELMPLAYQNLSAAAYEDDALLARL
jgi:hypothetical protein